MAGAVFPEDAADQATRFMVADALETTARALSGFDFGDRNALADLERLAPLLGSGTPYRAAIADTGVVATPVLMAAVIMTHIVQWASGGCDHLLIQTELPEMNGDRAEVTLVELTFDCVSSVADFDCFGASAARRDTCHQAFMALARHLESVSREHDAEVTYITATNFALGPDTLLDAADQLLRLALATRNAAAVALGLARRAQALTWRAETQPEHQLAAFDAVVAALRHVEHAGAYRDTTRELLGICVSNPYMNKLEYAFAAAFLGPDAGEIAGFSLVVREIWKIDPPDLPRFVPVVSALNKEIENARWRLEPKKQDTAIHASWITASFSHPKHHAVPHGRSIRIDERYEDLLLELDHEVTHIITMDSQLGLVSAALRAAAVELELVLWTFMGEENYTDLTSVGIAPLTTTDVVALAEAEQSLEIVRKMQILQATWTPWLEGVAVFGELAADPSERETATPVSDIIVNLEDTHLPWGDSQNFMNAYLGYRAKADRRYADVQRRAGGNRLRSYLANNGRKYLAGYLAVRGVVSAWRDIVNGPLSGSAALEVLLHITRFGVADAVPPLDLPVEEFAAAARERMLSWLDRTARVSANDLTDLLGPGTEAASTQRDVRLFGWRDGRLFAGTRQEGDPTAEYTNYVVTAMSSLRGPERSPPERVPDADDLCRYIMREAADALAAVDPKPRLAGRLLHLYADQMSILPLGSVSAPFWLNDRGSALVCAFRTTEARSDTEEPGYSLVVTPLDDGEYAKLREVVRAHPDRRMMVHRVADLAFHGPDTPDRGMGRNYLVFQFGEWLNIQNRGMFTGADNMPEHLTEDIRTRLLPPPFVATVQQLAAGKGATRVIHWIDSVPAWTSDHIDNLPVQPWARRVRELAVEVERGAAAYESGTNHALLRRLYGADTAELLRDDGLYGPVDEAVDVPRLTSALHLSAVGRGTDQWLSSLPVSSSVLEMFRHTEQGWDVNPITPR